MSTAEPTDPPRPPPSVFLSYAPEDRKAPQALSGLDGGDAGDQNIRRLIRECDFFMPVTPTQLKPTVFPPRSLHA
jgi:hypothetical protein